MKNWCNRPNVILEVLVHAEGFGNQLTEDMQKFPYDRVKWNLIVSNESDMERIEKIGDTCRNGSSNKTFYTAENKDFFREYVYLEMQDILAAPIDRKIDI